MSTSERVEFETATGRVSILRDRIIGVGESKVVGEDGYVTVIATVREPIEVTTPYAEACARVWPPQPGAAGVVWKRPGEAGREKGQHYMVVYNGVFSIFRWSGPDAANDGWIIEGVEAWAAFPPLPAWATGGAT